MGLTICLVEVKTRGRQKWGENSFSLVWLGVEIKEKIGDFEYFPPGPTKLQSLQIGEKIGRENESSTIIT